MDMSTEPPLMLVYMFAEGAEAARAGASGRLLRWCQAFDDWLAEREQSCHPSTLRASKTVWMRLLSHCKRAPWEMRQEDIEAHMEWLEAEGFVASTIANEISILSLFYRWCAQKGIDAACGEDFDPTAGVKRPKVVPYKKAQSLSGEQARALLAIFLEEGSILSLRDYAFFLARLRMGGKLAEIQQLQYGQMEGADLPEDVREAIMVYLRAAGRLEGSKPEDYIFAPLRDPLMVEASGKAEEWNEGRYLSTNHLNRILTKYGKLAGIPEEKLKLTALRHTATLLRVAAGDSLEELQAFLGKRQMDAAQQYLRWLGKAHEEGSKSGERAAEGEAVRLPERKSHHFKPWEGMTHGMWAKSQPPEEVAAMLAEGVQGLEEEIQGMRTLERMLLEMQGRAKNQRSKQKSTVLIQEFARLSNAHTLTAARLGGMIKAEKQLGEETGQGDAWVEQTLTALDKVAEAAGSPAPSEQVRHMTGEQDPELTLARRRLTEEIAAVRVSLRRTYELALEAGDADELMRLAEVYGAGCGRLLRLLKAEGEGGGKVREILEEALDQALKEVLEEFGLLEKEE